MKRNRGGDDNNIMSNYLVLLSGRRRDFSSVINRVFTCKTCDRQFMSFQALGGHRASHKKPRLMAGDDDQPLSSLSPPKTKSHGCSICGVEFPMGQALGGHMRRHRSTPANVIGDDHHQNTKQIKRPFLCLDLNLTPLENKFVFGLFLN